MAPKKEKAQKLSLGEFLGETGGVSSWADEVEDTYGSGTQSFPSTDRRTGPSSYGNSTSYGNDRGYHSLRDNLPQELPTKPPYTAHLGNLSYDATVESVTDFFHDCNCVNVRIIEDREQNRPKGFAYAEFADLEGLKTALTRDGQSFEGRNIRIKVADPPRGGFGDRTESFRELDWGAKRGPLADTGGRSNRDFGDRRPPREFNDERPVREAKEINWERRGPLPPAERPESREGARARNTTDFSAARRASPAAWGPGEGRQGGDGSRPPRREFAERPERPERVPTAAEKEINWRNNMRPVEPKSREGSEAPGSPAAAPAAQPAGRPRLNLTKRTVSEAPDVISPAPTSKSNPFGAARPIDTAAREREVEEKRIRDKQEAEERAKAEKEAKEAAAVEAAEKAKAEEAAAAEAAAEAAEKAKADAEAAAAAGTKPEVQEGEGEQKLPVRTREPREPAPKSRAAESGSWRRAGDAPARGPPSGPRRSGGAPRAPRQDGGRPPRSNGTTDARGPLSPTTEKAPASPAVDDDGWTTVTQPVKGRRGGNRPLA